MGKKSITVRLPEELLEKARDIAFWTPGKNLNHIIEEAVVTAIKDIESKEGVFEKRTGHIRRGRPLNENNEKQ